MNWICRLLRDFGTPPGSQLTGASRTSSDVVKQNWSMDESPCWLPWVTSRLSHSEKSIETLCMPLCQTWVTRHLKRLQGANAKVQHDVQCTLRNALHGCDEVLFCNQQIGKSFASVSLYDVNAPSMSLHCGQCCLIWLRITGKFPGYLSPSAGLKFADVPNGLAAISKVPAAGWGQILAYMAFCEVSQDQSAGTPAAAGDFGFKVLTSSDPAEKTKKLNAELANGRLAMMAIIGMFFQATLQHDLCSLKDIWSFTWCGFKTTLWQHLYDEMKKFVWFCDVGRLDWQCMGRLGQLHCLSFACLRERVGSPGTKNLKYLWQSLILFVSFFVFDHEDIR